MTSLESSSLGPTNRPVSRLGFGGAPTGHYNYLEEYSPERADHRERAIAAIQHAADSGITYFDTAPAYGKGEGERIFGEALAGRVAAPSDVLHADPPTVTEGHPSTGSGWRADSTPQHNANGLAPSPSPSMGEGETADSPAPSTFTATGTTPENEARLFIATKVSPNESDVRGSIERSLRNLRVDRLDLVQIHGGSYADEQEDYILRRGGMLEVIEKARDEGLLRHIGFTTEDQNAAVYRFIESGRFEVMQMQYNLLYQHPYSPALGIGSIYAARKAGIGVVTMRSLASGVLQRWLKLIRPDDDFDYTAALLQFTLSNPLIDVALAGMRTPEEVDRNIAVLNDTSGRIDLDKLHDMFV